MASARSKEGVCGVRSVVWRDGVVEMIDQTVLPAELKLVRCSTVRLVFDAIKTMQVRGAPAIGAAGGFGVAIAAMDAAAAPGSSAESVLTAVREAKATLDSARPTAVNLTWATARLVAVAEAAVATGDATAQLVCDQVVHESVELAEQDVDINRRLAEAGAEVVPTGANILHHCNTGALATVDIGTALGVVYECHAQGKGVHVWVDETRPRLQGARLTAWELMRAGVPMHLIADNAAGILMLSGRVDVVLVGADRVTLNGDVANKVGTYKLSVLAKENGVPFYACVPTSTIDLTLSSGAEVEIEERGDSEVTMVGDTRIAPEGVPVYNPAFDVTPHRYLTGIITEEGVCYPPYSVSLRRAKQRAEERVQEAWRARLQAVAATSPA